MHAVRLYDFPFSGNGYKVRLALSMLGLAVDYHVVDILAGETRTPAFLAMSPIGQIPVLELSDGTFLWESNAILHWLADGTPLMPASRLDRARMIRWMCFEQNRLDKVLGRAKFLKAFPGFRETTEAEFDAWHAEGHEALGVVEGELADRPFILGETLGAADICLYGYIHSARDGGFDLDRFPAVCAWTERFARQPGYVTLDEV
jgi:glutathione S-transferase